MFTNGMICATALIRQQTVSWVVIKLKATNTSESCFLLIRGKRIVLFILYKTHLYLSAKEQCVLSNDMICSIALTR